MNNVDYGDPSDSSGFDPPQENDNSEPYQFFYVDFGKMSGFTLARNGREAFEQMYHFIGVKTPKGGKVYSTAIIDGILVGQGKPVWKEHPEGDPIRSDKTDDFE